MDGLCLFDRWFILAGLQIFKISLVIYDVHIIYFHIDCCKVSGSRLKLFCTS